MRVLRWVAVVAVVTLLAVGGWAFERRWRVEPLPVAAYLWPDQPTARPSHVVLPESALADFKVDLLDPGPLVDSVGYWRPKRKEIVDLEMHLPEISAMRPLYWRDLPTIQDPSSYNLQFLGVVMNGRREIFVNAACDLWDEMTPQWSNHLLLVSDGFTCFWHVFYEPDTRMFTGFGINGRA